MKHINICDINSKINSNVNGFINDAERLYQKNLLVTANSIKKNCAEKPIVLLSGPSGSGKTTSALRISKILNESGISSKVISMDNYFLPCTEDNLPMDGNGNVDLESPYRLDIRLLKEHMNAISNCMEIQIPTFDFSTQTRSAFTPYKHQENEIVIFEGIHALNPLVTNVRSDATCIYVSVRTRIVNQKGEYLHPRKIRLMRRLIRDSLFRGRKFEEVSEMFESVSKGEELYIMPFKTRADFDIDTFMAFEPSVYLAFLMDGLKNLGNCNGFDNCKKILQFLGEITPIDPQLVGETSLVREFIGGSTFTY